MRKLLFSNHRLARYFVSFFLLFVLMPYRAGAYHGSDQKPVSSFGESFLDAGGRLGEALLDDGSYLFRSVFNDVGDILKAPFEGDEIISTKNIVTSALLLSAVPATIYGLDNPVRRNVRHMNDETASVLQNAGLGTTLGGLGLVYGWGVLSQNEEARHVALTGLEAMGAVSLTGLGVKAAFGRRRPSEGEGPRAFFKGGDSFPSGKTGLAFVAATALSEGFDNRWWAAVPAYSLAFMTGVGRMGKDAHWASDILVSAIGGIGTTKLLFYLHRQREWPSSLAIVPMTTDKGVAGASLRFSW